MKYLKANINKPINFSICGNFTCDDRWSHMERIIDTFEIIIVNKGTIYIQQDDEKYILNKGDILMLQPGMIHKGYDYSNKGSNFYWFHFLPYDDYEMLNSPQAIDVLSLLSNNPYYDGLKSSILIPTLSTNLNLDKINILFHQLLHLSQSNYYTNYSLNYILTSLLIEISEQVILNHKAIGENSSSQNTLSKIIQWINIHITQNISLEDVSYEFNFSKEYLARYFKKNMGMTMQQYINSLRISKAKKLLCNSDFNIKEISQELGFVDEKYFLKLFKKYENITPKQYRNAYSKTFINNV